MASNTTPEPKNLMAPETDLLDRLTEALYYLHTAKNKRHKARLKRRADRLSLTAVVSGLLKTEEDIEALARRVSNLDREGAAVYKGTRTDLRRIGRKLWDGIREKRIQRPATVDGAWLPSEVSDLDQLTPSGFEQYVADALRAIGWPRVECVGRSNDKGVDVIAKSTSETLVVQCKRYKETNRVNSPDAQCFVGGAQFHKGTRMALVTLTNKFTREAREFIAGTDVETVSRDDFQAWYETRRTPWALVPAGDQREPLPPEHPIGRRAAYLLALPTVFVLGMLISAVPDAPAGKSLLVLLLTILQASVGGYATVVFYFLRAHWWRVSLRTHWRGWYWTRSTGWIHITDDGTVRHPSRDAAQHFIERSTKLGTIPTAGEISRRFGVSTVTARLWLTTPIQSSASQEKQDPVSGAVSADGS